MVFSVVITRPDSLDEAKHKAKQVARLMGYRFLGEPQAYWQPNLFNRQEDATVIAKVRRASVPARQKAARHPQRQPRSRMA